MQTMYRMLYENWHIVGVLCGVVIPAIVFAIPEYLTQSSYRKVYARKY